MPYIELCFAVLRPLIAESELSTADLRTVLRTALGVFHDPCVVPTVPLGDDARIFMCELWHGPTLAFKDLGLQVLGALLHHFLAKRNERLMVLVGTSGDTGNANRSGSELSAFLFVTFICSRAPHTTASFSALKNSSRR
jgi:threonine synthase